MVRGSGARGAVTWRPANLGTDLQRAISCAFGALPASETARRDHRRAARTVCCDWT